MNFAVLLKPFRYDPVLEYLLLTLLTVTVSASRANAALTISISEIGANVETTLSGSLDVSGLTPTNESFTSGAGLNGEIGTIGFLPSVLSPEGVPLDAYIGLIDAPDNLVFASGSGTVADIFTGDFLLINALSNFAFSGNTVALSIGYSGGTLNSKIIFNNQSLTSLNLLTGSYTSGFNQGADSITIQVLQSAQPVPEPLTLLGAGAALTFGVAFKGRFTRSKP